MGKNKKNAGKSRENSAAPTQSIPQQVVKEGVDSYLKKDTYLSDPQADHGFDYQYEWLLYFCLIVSKCSDRDWCVGFEVEEAKPFDDIVIEFKIKELKYCYLVQTKHDKYCKQTVNNFHLLDSSPKSKNSDKIQISFNINKYYKKFLSQEYSKDLLRKFIILANHDYQEKSTESHIKEPSPIRIEDLERKEETDQVFREIFQKLTEIQSSVMEKEKKFDVVKFEKIILDRNEITEQEFKDNLIYIFNLPKLDDMKVINNIIMEEMYDFFRTKNFQKVRNNLIDHIQEIDRPETITVVENGQEVSKTVSKKYRTKMTAEDFDTIIYKSVLEVDIPTMSADFLGQFPDWLDFEQNSLEKLKDTREYFCTGSAKLMAYMVYKAHNELNPKEKVYCICYSKLKEMCQNLYKKALEKFEKKVICFVEEYDPNEKFNDFKTAIFIIKSPDNQDNFSSKESKWQCTFKDLTAEAKESFLHDKICFQGKHVELSKISSDAEVLTEILQMKFEQKDVLNYFSSLPDSFFKKKPNVFIDRCFTRDGQKHEIYTEEDVYKQGENSIIMGLAGVGKSTTMLNVAQKVKSQNPKLFVHFVDLKKHSEDLKEMQVKCKTDNTFNVLKFFRENFIEYSTTNDISRNVEHLIIRDYLEKEKPKFVVFLDGFDEVCPHYTEQVIEIVKELTKKNIQILLSSQPHLRKELNDLQFNAIFNLEPYDVNMQRQFLRTYWTENLKLMVERKQVQQDEIVVKNILVYTKKFLKMCYRSKLTDTVPSIPLLLNVIADIYLNDCMEFCNKANAKWSETILHVDVLGIYEDIFDKLWERFYSKTKEDASNFIIRERTPKLYREVREDYMKIASKSLLSKFWDGETKLNLSTGEIELIERGFVTKNQKNDFIFIYSTFEEFFAAHWLTKKIFPEDLTINVRMLQALFDRTPKDRLHRGVKCFVCRLMLKEIKSENFEERMRRSGEGIRAEVSRILLEFLPNAWFDREFDLLEATFGLVEKFCDKYDVRQFFEVKHFLTKIPFISAQYLQKTVTLHDYYVSPTRTDEILKKREKEIFEKFVVKDSNFDLFEELFKVVTQRNIYSEDQFKKKTYEYFRKNLSKKVSNWKFVQDMFLWFFEKIGKTEDDVFKEFVELLNGSENDFKENRYYIGHILASYHKYSTKSELFLKRVCEEVKKNKKYYRFLYSLNSINRDDFTKEVFVVLQQMDCDFICEDERSVVCHAFEGNNSYFLEVFFPLFSDDQVRKQIAKEHCGGVSLLQQWIRDNYLTECFVREVIRKFGESYILDLYVPVNEADSDAAIEANINLLNVVYAKKIEVGQSFLREFVNKLYSEGVEHSRFFLHLVAKYVKHPEIVDAIFLDLMKRNVLIGEIEKQDGNGDTALHIEAKIDKTIFIDGLFQCFPNEKIIPWMNIRNNDGQNVHDLKGLNTK